MKSFSMIDITENTLRETPSRGVVRLIRDDI